MRSLTPDPFHVVSTSEVGVAFTIVQKFVSKSDLVRAFTGLLLSASVHRAPETD